MTYFHPSNKELNHRYGYAAQRWDLDTTQKAWTNKSNLEWSRPVEIACTLDAGGGESAEPSTGCITAADAELFTRGSRIGFQYIARRHNLSPMQMWGKVSEGLVAVGMHPDDMGDVQELLFGWKDLSAEMLERYRWRYPDRCPLLDALCTLDDTCFELNQVQDWILEIKGAKNRRRLDLFPALPEPDGVRPKGETIDIVKYYAELTS